MMITKSWAWLLLGGLFWLLAMLTIETEGLGLIKSLIVLLFVVICTGVYAILSALEKRN